MFSLCIVDPLGLRLSAQGASVEEKEKVDLHCLLCFTFFYVLHMALAVHMVSSDNYAGHSASSLSSGWWMLILTFVYF